MLTKNIHKVKTLKGDERRAYWNETYADYWRLRVREAEDGPGESKVIEGDAKTESDSVYESIFEITPPEPGRILDVGCGWGRFFPIYKKLGFKISAIDISTAMVESARLSWSEDPMVDCIEEAEAEALPFGDGEFDTLVCLAVFDATFQDQSLAEFLRVVRPGGLIYFTGKNSRYHTDDIAASQAEEGARRKDHPNFFTNVPILEQVLEDAGHVVEKGYYFPSRGDFAKFNYESNRPDRFYEYLLIVRKGADGSVVLPSGELFSETFRQLNSGE